MYNLEKSTWYIEKATSDFNKSSAYHTLSTHTAIETYDTRVLLLLLLLRITPIHPLKQKNQKKKKKETQKMSRSCSQCGTNGHNCRTCGNGGGGDGESISEFMLFGVRVKVDPMRKSVSMNNLSDYEPLPLPNPVSPKNSQDDVNHSAHHLALAAAAGYASADDPNPHHSTAAARERKRGLTRHSLLLLLQFI